MPLYTFRFLEQQVHSKMLRQGQTACFVQGFIFGACIAGAMTMYLTDRLLLWEGSQCGLDGTEVQVLNEL